MGSLGDNSVPKQIKEGFWPAANDRGYSIDERPAFTPRRMKIIAIGAGLGGIITALQVDQRRDEFDLIVFDKAPETGGNWFWNKYPGIACDNPGVTYQLIKEVKTDWTYFYSQGQEICGYLQGIVKQNNLEKYFKLNTEVMKAEWNDETSKWTVTLKDLDTGKVSIEVADVVISAVGPLHHPKWPDLKNMDKYRGTLVHASRYPDNLDLKGKRVAVLGTGSTGVQVVPTILGEVEKIYHWIRQPTYIFPLDAAKANFEFTDEHKKQFAEDPEYFLKYRKALESDGK
ncbi:FAD/NAD-P-binding domain-containing protein [Ilyonectria robusta]